MTELLVIVPTYNRPQSVKRTMEAFGATCQKNTSVLFVVDNTDPKLGEYVGAVRDFGGELLIAETRGMINALNAGAQFAAARGHQNIAFFGDDHLPRTVGWDRRYIEVLNRPGFHMVYGNDLLQGEIMPTQIAMNSDLVLELGYFAPPQFRHLCVDLVWLEIGKALDRITYLDDVVIEHLHPANGKAEFDEDYARVNSSEIVSQDAQEFYRWKEHDLSIVVHHMEKWL